MGSSVFLGPEPQTIWRYFKIGCLVATLLAVLLIGGCIYQLFFTNDVLPTWWCNRPADAQGIPRCPISAGYLDAQPEGHLIYPGSRVLSRHEEDESVGIDANSNALISSSVQAPASADQVVSWYKGRLAALGWKADTTTLPPLYNWTRGRKWFQVSIEKATSDQTTYTYYFNIQSGGWRGG